MANSIGQIVDERYKQIWTSVNQKTDGKIVELMKAVSDYMSILAHNMPFLFTQPFDAVHENIGEININLAHPGVSYCFILKFICAIQYLKMKMTSIVLN